MSELGDLTRWKNRRPLQSPLGFSVYLQQLTLTLCKTQCNDILILDLPPKEKVFYNKEIQTVDLEEPPSPEKQKGVDQAVESSPTPEPEISKNEEEEQDKVEVPEISETERQSIIQSDSFKHFLESSTKVLERVLSLEEKQDYDWMKDYTTDFAISKDENKNQKLKPLGKFYDEKLCRGRAVTALDWSPIHPELHLASYNRSTSLGSQTDPDGLICVWNAHVESSPEFVFNSQSDILSSIFHPFNPHLIISATYTGQILIYDTRSLSTLPSLKTPLSVLGHTHPIYGMKYVGTKNAGTLVTGSTDGAVCGWQLDMLGAAAESIELIHPTHPRTEEVSITTLDFPGNETTTFWIGTEEGNLYQGFRYDRAGSKAGLNVFDVYKGHNGMVTSVHFHPANGPIDFSDLILSSSVDWTVRLWRAKSLTKPATTLTTHSPVHSFEEADDYVNDAKWSPVHPALFASVDGTGRVDLWNLNTDTEVRVIYYFTSILNACTPGGY
ncbi:WD40-repeat-containing domain protein [Paraphysoderma sedebokerense]|nr:WD40-repeat-containing domain protein [Paraphysoderma sedebokerense]